MSQKKRVYLLPECKPVENVENVIREGTSLTLFKHVLGKFHNNRSIFVIKYSGFNIHGKRRGWDFKRVQN